MTSLRVSPNKRFKDPRTFICTPTLNMGASEGEVTAYVSEPLTPTTGAELRALADQADAMWAEFVAFRDGEEVPA